MIEIKTHFNDWKETDEKTALEYAKFLYNSITTKINKIDYINNERIKGIRFTEKDLIRKEN